jgi:hypothetical protein
VLGSCKVGIDSRLSEGGEYVVGMGSLVTG